jgi:hypothetical protein
MSVIDLSVTNLCDRTHKLTEDVAEEPLPDHISYNDWIALRSAVVFLAHEVNEKIAIVHEIARERGLRMVSDLRDLPADRERWAEYAERARMSRLDESPEVE